MTASITRVGPVKNMDTEEILDIGSKMTRSMLHRILNKNNIHHDVNWGFEALVNLMLINNIPFQPVEPGNKEPAQETSETPGTLTLEDIQKQMLVLHNMMAALTPKEHKKPELTVVPEVKEIAMAKDGHPKSVWVLRKLCREKGIPTNKKDTRLILIEKLKEH